MELLLPTRRQAQLPMHRAFLELRVEPLVTPGHWAIGLFDEGGRERVTEGGERRKREEEKREREGREGQKGTERGSQRGPAPARCAPGAWTHRAQ